MVAVISTAGIEGENMTGFYGVVTVSDKGQIAIPIDVRRDLGIKKGDRLIIIRRKDDAGIVLLKSEKMDPLAARISNDDSYFRENES